MGKAKKPTVKLSDRNGNVFGIISRTRRALISAGEAKEIVNQYTQACMSSDNYDKVIQITMEYVEVE